MSVRDPRGRQVLLAGALLFTATALVYSGVRRNGFVTFDDGLYIYENARVQAGPSWETVKWALTTFRASNWHPLTWLSHSFDCRLFGLDAGEHHLASAALHALNAVILFAALARMTRAFWPSLAAATLFAVHPLRVESVAWAAERKDVLAGTFWMATLWLYARYAERPGPARYAAVAASLALGLMAKPTLLPMPMVLLLLDAWPLGRAKDRRRLPALVVEKLPLVALSVAAGVMTLLGQGGGGALVGVPFFHRVGNAFVSYVLYLAKFLWPAGLAVFYPHSALGSRPAAAAFFVMALVSAGAIAAVTLAAIRAFGRRPYFAVGWLWYLVALVPMIGLIQVGRQAMADRYFYLPGIGLGIVLAWGAREVVERRPGLRPAVAVAAAAIVAGAASLTVLQIRHWRDSETLYRHALAATRDNYLAHNNLGAVLQLEGNLAGAEREYERSLAIAPEFADANVNLATVYLARGDTARALDLFRRALRAQPDHRNASYHLGLLLAAKGDLAGAAAQYERALAIDPEFAKAHTNLGVVRLRQGALGEAALHFERALDADPDNVNARMNLAFVLAREGKLEDAAKHFEEGLRLAPGDVRALDLLGAAYAELGRWDEAVAAATRASSLAAAAGKRELQQKVEARLAQYRSRRPYRHDWTMPPS